MVRALALHMCHMHIAGPVGYVIQVHLTACAGPVCCLQEVQGLKNCIREQENTARQREAALADQYAHLQELQVSINGTCSHNVRYPPCNQ